MFEEALLEDLFSLVVRQAARPDLTQLFVQLFDALVQALNLQLIALYGLRLLPYGFHGLASFGIFTGLIHELFDVL